MNILFFGNCITEKCYERRKNMEYMAVSSRKKILVLCKEIEDLGHHIDVVSASFSKYSDRMFVENISTNIRMIHSPTIGLWGMTSFFKKTVSTLFGILWLLFHLGHYQVVVLYNYHIEFSLPGILFRCASYIKNAYQYKLVMDYEDALFLDKGYQGFLYGQWEKLAYRCVDFFILANEGLRDRLSERHQGQYHGIIINGFIDRPLLLASSQNNKARVERVLFSGNFSRNFGFEQLLVYAKYLGNAIHFDITGKASKQEVQELQEHIRDLPNVHYHGFLEEKEFDNIIQMADACILLNDVDSPYNRTNFPSKFFDYLSRNKFILTSDNPILRPYYDIRNVVVLRDFPDDVKRIHQLCENRKTNRSSIMALADRIQRDLSEAIGI